MAGRNDVILDQPIQQIDSLGMGLPQSKPCGSGSVTFQSGIDGGWPARLDRERRPDKSWPTAEETTELHFRLALTTMLCASKFGPLYDKPLAPLQAAAIVGKARKLAGETT